MKTIPKRWLMDLGNSRLKCAPLDAHGHRGEILAIGHEHANWLPTLLRQLGESAAGDEVWLASVAPDERTAALVDALHEAGFSVPRLQTQAAFGKVRIAYPEPARLGVDRFLALLGASARDDGPWLIVSAGSALTVDLLRTDGVHAGGLIAPMPAQMRAALARQFVQLDVPEGLAQEFADDTADAIASGCREAALGLIERALRNARLRLGAQPTLLVSGGGGDFLGELEHSPTIFVPSLVLDGMAAFVRGGSA